MVQAVENWCCVLGTVVKAEMPGPNSSGNAGQIALQIKVDKVAPIAGFPTLLSAEPATVIVVQVLQPQIGKLRQIAGQRVAVPTRVAGPERYFAHPDWSLAQGSPMCGKD